jgi:hypothetical protein
MQLSVYTDAGLKNCRQEPGSLGYEAIDKKTFASWGADAVGVDYVECRLTPCSTCCRLAAAISRLRCVPIDTYMQCTRVYYELRKS